MQQSEDFLALIARQAREAALRHEEMCRERERFLLHHLESATLEGGAEKLRQVVEELSDEDRELLVDRFPDLLTRLSSSAQPSSEVGLDLGAAFRAIEIIRHAKSVSQERMSQDALGVSINLPDLFVLARKGNITEARGLLAARELAVAERNGFWAILRLAVRKETWFWWRRIKRGAGSN